MASNCLRCFSGKKYHECLTAVLEQFSTYRIRGTGVYKFFRKDDKQGEIATGAWHISLLRYFLFSTFRFLSTLFIYFPFSHNAFTGIWLVSSSTSTCCLGLQMIAARRFQELMTYHIPITFLPQNCRPTIFHTENHSEWRPSKWKV